MKKFIKKFNSGFSIVESMVAIAVVTLAITSATSVVQNSFKSVQITRARIQAMYLASEAIEFGRNLRDSAIVSGSTGNNFSGSVNSFANECKNDGCFVDVLSNINKYGKCNNDSCGDIYLTNTKYTSDNSEGNKKTVFNRRVYTELSGDGQELKVNVTVSYTVRGFSEEIVLDSYLMNHE